MSKQKVQSKLLNTTSSSALATSSNESLMNHTEKLLVGTAICSSYTYPKSFEIYIKNGDLYDDSMLRNNLGEMIYRGDFNLNDFKSGGVEVDQEEYILIDAMEQSGQYGAGFEDADGNHWTIRLPLEGVSKEERTIRLHKIAKTGTYGHLLSKPVLNTNNSSSLAFNSAETINGTIKLHKISKTGYYTDLLTKPILNTVSTGSLATNASETITGTLYLHKVSKTGKLNDMAEKAYTNLTNKPTLKTTNTSSQSTSSSETITGTINLHKVSKTGNLNDMAEKKYTSLTDKPILKTNNSISLATNASETITGTINLHQMAKTGKVADAYDYPIKSGFVADEPGLLAAYFGRKWWDKSAYEWLYSINASYSYIKIGRFIKLDMIMNHNWDKSNESNTISGGDKIIVNYKQALQDITGSVQSSPWTSYASIVFKCSNANLDMGGQSYDFLASFIGDETINNVSYGVFMIKSAANYQSVKLPAIGQVFVTMDFII